MCLPFNFLWSMFQFLKHTTESIGAPHRVLIQSPKCLTGEVSIRGESEGWLSGCLGALQRPSAMTPSGYTDTLQTTLAWAAGLSDCSQPTAGNLCSRPTHLDTAGHYECVQTVFTYVPLALSSYANRAAGLSIFPVSRDVQLMATPYNKHVSTDVSAAHQSKRLGSFITSAG